MSKHTFFETILDTFAPRSKESLEVAERLNKIDGQVRVSSRGAVSISANNILHDATFAKACDDAQEVIKNSI